MPQLRFEPNSSQTQGYTFSVSRFFWILKVLNRVNKVGPPGTIISNMNPVRYLTQYFFKIYF
jgi:hypothetical protein